jgi:hypothetical protein
MSNFVALPDVVISNVFTFGEIRSDVLNQVLCADGKVASWQLTELIDENFETTQAIRIFDSSTGEDVLLGIQKSVPGADLLGGLFKTGVLPDRAVDDVDCQFYRVDY